MIKSLPLFFTKGTSMQNRLLTKLVGGAALMIIGAPLYGISCIHDGMNLWKLAENISCSTGAYCELRQSNLPPTLTAPGHYKLCEDIVIGGDGLDFEIQADNVIIDLGGYTMENINVGVLPGQKNIIIRNGTIRNSIQPIQVSGADGNTQNILIEDIIIDTVRAGLVPANSVGIRALSVVGLTIRNITIYNGSPLNLVLADNLGPAEGVVLENITCINTNPDFVVAPANPSAVVYIAGCNDLVMRNISLIDQWEELNGILFQECTNILVDGVSITTTLEFTETSTTAYATPDCVVGSHKNIFIDGGENQVFAFGIDTTDSSEQIFDACFIELIGDTGFYVEDENTVLNSIVRNCGSSCFDIQTDVYVENCSVSHATQGFLLSGVESLVENCTATSCSQYAFIMVAELNQIVGCTAFNNGNYGFFTEATDCLFESCIARLNGLNGFSIYGNRCILNACSSYNNSIGFDIAVTNGCLISNSIANDNATYGFSISNINAESVFSGASTPTNGTWNIGQFPASRVTTNNRNVRFIGNSALRNGAGPFVMSGTVFDTNNVFGSTAFVSTPIFPPIGVLNTLQGYIYDDLKPLENTSVGGFTGLISPTTTLPLFANTVGGNIFDNQPVPVI